MALFEKLRSQWSGMFRPGAGGIAKNMSASAKPIAAINRYSSKNCNMLIAQFLRISGSPDIFPRELYICNI
jgi:hypothetical protein